MSTGIGHRAVLRAVLQQEELDLGVGVEGEALLGRPGQRPAQHVPRVGPGRAAVGQQDVAEHPGALAADPALEREDLERGRVRHGDHVRLEDPGEALDRRAVEADALLEGRLQLGRRHRDALERAEHVGEPQPDEPDVPLFQRAEDELLLTVHFHPSRHVCVRTRSGRARPDRPVFTGPGYADVTRTAAGRALASRRGPVGHAAAAAEPPPRRAPSRQVAPSRRESDCRTGWGKMETCPPCVSPWPRSTRRVGDLAGNADLVRSWTRRAADAGAQLVAVPGDDADRLPGRGPGLPALLRGRVPGRAATGSPPTWPPTASASCRSSSATWTPTGRRRSAPTPSRAGAPATPPRVLHRGEVVATLLQAPPAQLRRLRRGPLLRPRRHADGGADRRRRRRADHLRGPVAGRRPVRGGPAGRRRPGGQHQRLAVRAEQGRRPAAAGPPPGRRGRAPPSRTSTWSAARTSWSSTATR